MLAQYPKVRLAVYLVSLALTTLGVSLTADSIPQGLLIAGTALAGVVTGTAVSHMPPTTKR